MGFWGTGKVFTDQAAGMCGYFRIPVRPEKQAGLLPESPEGGRNEWKNKGKTGKPV